MINILKRKKNKNKKLKYCNMIWEKNICWYVYVWGWSELIFDVLYMKYVLDNFIFFF